MVHNIPLCQTGIEGCTVHGNEANATVYQCSQQATTVDKATNGHYSIFKCHCNFKQLRIAHRYKIAQIRNTKYVKWILNVMLRINYFIF